VFFGGRLEFFGFEQYEHPKSQQDSYQPLDQTLDASAVQYLP